MRIRHELEDFNKPEVIITGNVSREGSVGKLGRGAGMGSRHFSEVLLLSECSYGQMGPSGCHWHKIREDKASSNKTSCWL